MREIFRTRILASAKIGISICNCPAFENANGLAYFKPQIFDWRKSPNTLFLQAISVRFFRKCICMLNTRPKFFNVVKILIRHFWVRSKVQFGNKKTQRRIVFYYSQTHLSCGFSHTTKRAVNKRKLRFDQARN
ncbi:MAG: hypothetical protein DKT66_22170 [Candidatus Melainabacteria bacterium]|nr:MAG: hypothetical protein DKT66_22170 [Candidatus Melainabacteria bacterium]